ncbi:MULTISPECIES: cation:proton antiporter regulatory subunit [Bacillaceae]|uniref:cation:proton antiporter regulatory subunit n=1 Tax=Bacillaceae TaxID=186817 RepID=UPI000BA5D532|nr:TrkA C-terminal domain-containing protein [Virgibacillus sp. 7505]PAE15098.1 potassium transporter TrkA [Virgibacillus sp. 7505]
MKCHISQLPGIGSKITLRTGEEGMVVIIVHHSGKRELYFFEDASNDEADFAMDLTADETRELGAQLLGATYQPVDTDQLKLFRKQIIVDYIELSESSEIANKTLGEAAVRSKTGVTVIGIIQGDETIAIPEPDTVLHPGDVLMSIGKKVQIDAMIDLCAGKDEQT